MANQSITIAAVQAIIVHEFNDPSLLTESLQAAGSQITFAGTRAIPDGNKRLALLGDTVLKLALLDHWYERGGSRVTGDNSVQRQASNADLVMIGRQNGLEAYVNANPSQLGVVPNGTLAATVEAILGAVYLDTARDIDIVKAVMRALGLGPA